MLLEDIFRILSPIFILLVDTDGLAPVDVSQSKKSLKSEINLLSKLFTEDLAEGKSPISLICPDISCGRVVLYTTEYVVTPPDV